MTSNNRTASGEGAAGATRKKVAKKVARKKATKKTPRKKTTTKVARKKTATKKKTAKTKKTAKKTQPVGKKAPRTKAPRKKTPSRKRAKAPAPSPSKTPAASTGDAAPIDSVQHYGASAAPLEELAAQADERAVSANGHGAGRKSWLGRLLSILRR